MKVPFPETSTELFEMMRLLLLWYVPPLKFKTPPTRRVDLTCPPPVTPRDPLPDFVNVPLKPERLPAKELLPDWLTVKVPPCEKSILPPEPARPPTVSDSPDSFSAPELIVRLL